MDAKTAKISSTKIVEDRGAKKLIYYSIIFLSIHFPTTEAAWNTGYEAKEKVLQNTAKILAFSSFWGIKFGAHTYPLKGL